MSIYIYGITDSKDKLDGSLKGLEKAVVYNMPYQDIGAVVSDFNGEIRPIAESCVMKHEEVIEEIMRDFTVLPVKFLTIFEKQENVLIMMKERYDGFKENLNRLRNKAEFGIKIIWAGGKIKENISDSHNGNVQDPPISGNSPAKNYMREKFGKYKINSEFEAAANKRIKMVDDFLSKFAAEKKLNVLKSENLLLDASYLVERDKECKFRAAFEHFKNISGDMKSLFSGPWPPYNFINLPIKDKV